MEVLPEKMLFQIPDKMMDYRLFSTSVSLVDGEALSAKPGLNEIFNTLMSFPDHVFESLVVKMEATHQVINLFDTNKKQNIIKHVLGLHNDLIIKFRGVLPTPPFIPKIEVRFYAILQFFKTILCIHIYIYFQYRFLIHHCCLKHWYLEPVTV